MAAPMESGSPILCPAEPVNKTPTWPRLRNRRRRLVRVTESGGRRAKGFHRPPAAERRLSIKCARWGREEREVKGDASSQRVRGCLLPVRSCRSCGAGEGKEGEGRRPWRCPPRPRGSPGPSSLLRSEGLGGGGGPGERPAAPGRAGRAAAGVRGCPGEGRCFPLSPCRADGAVPVGFRRTCNEWQDGLAPYVAN